MGLFKKLGKAVAGGAIASSKKMAPAMAGAVAKAAQPKSDAIIKNQSDLARAAAAHFASSEKMQPALGATGGIRGAMQSGSLKGVDAETASKYQKALAASKAPRMNDRPIDIASKKAAPMMAGAVAAATKKMQPALSGATAKPSIGAALQKKPIGKALGRGLVGLKKRP